MHASWSLQQLKIISCLPAALSRFTEAALQALLQLDVSSRQHQQEQQQQQPRPATQQQQQYGPVVGYGTAAMPIDRLLMLWQVLGTSCKLKYLDRVTITDLTVLITTDPQWLGKSSSSSSSSFDGISPAVYEWIVDSMEANGVGIAISRDKLISRNSSRSSSGGNSSSQRYTQPRSCQSCCSSCWRITLATCTQYAAGRHKSDKQLLVLLLWVASRMIPLKVVWCQQAT